MEPVAHAPWLWLIPVLPLLGAFINGTMGMNLQAGFIRQCPNG